MLSIGRLIVLLSASGMSLLASAQMASAQLRPPADIAQPGPAAPVGAPAEPVPMDAASAVSANQRALPKAHTAAEAANAMAAVLGNVGVGLSSDEMVAALEGAAEAGEPTALWRLGVMYENGEGVEKDQARAFSYFARIANEHADTSPRSIEADVVAQSFVKVGTYYREGLPEAGIQADNRRSTALLLHAATFFGDADAQYRVGELYLTDESLGGSPLQGARWLQLAAQKGHVLAQARLGDLLFQGSENLPPQPEEGLIWLNIAQISAMGTSDEQQVNEWASSAMSIATPDQRKRAIQAAEDYLNGRR
jgi:TPR repeat protein